MAKKKKKTFTWGNEIELNVGDDGKIFLDEPTTKQLNEYYDSRTKTVGRGKKADIKNNSTFASVAFFDELFNRAELVMVYDPEKKKKVLLSKETLHLVPARKKTEAIAAGIMRDDDISTDQDDEDEGDESNTKKS